MASTQIPGGAKTLAKRRAAKSSSKDSPASSRAAGAGGSSASVLKIFNEEAQGLKVDPLVVLVFAVSFIFSVVALHLLAKFTARAL
ncbi:Arf family guanine nucleotide exchange factor [Martiniozyma asiatica (nom. inval.)]|nr:Arf family guanine nucleotide exchange factor [Martiniozyma asiatica]